MNDNPFRSNMELFSERSTFEKIEPKEVVEVNEEAKDDEGDDERAPVVLVRAGGGGHVEVACLVRLGVLNMLLLLS